MNKEQGAEIISIAFNVEAEAKHITIELTENTTSVETDTYKMVYNHEEDNLLVFKKKGAGYSQFETGFKICPVTIHQTKKVLNLFKSAYLQRE